MKIALRGLCLPFLVIFLAGCGGGGGESSSTGSSYAGLTTAAVISDNNAEAISLEALQGGAWGDTGSLMPLDAGRGTGTAAGGPKILPILRVLADAARGIPYAGTAGTKGIAGPKVVETVNDTVYDGLGGYYSYSLSMETTTAAFWGTIRYVDFHEAPGTTVSGTVNVTGTISSPSAGEITMSLASLDVTEAGTTVRATGTIAMTFTETTAGVTMDLVICDTSTGKAVWISDYTVSMTEGAGYSLVRIDGRIYIHDYGYVDVLTETDFRYDTGAANPSAGALKVTGSGNRFARLTVIDSSSYRVDADCNGDGTIDFTGYGTW